MVTRRKLDKVVRAERVGPRRHITFIMPFDLIALIDARCAQLNCSRGVLCELIFRRAAASDWAGVVSADVVRYDSEQRSEAVKAGTLSSRKGAMRAYIRGRYNRLSYRRPL